MNGRQLGGALAVIALLTLVLPPLAAYRVNRARIDRAHEDVQRIADDVAKNRGPVAEGGAVSQRPEVLAGTGEVPRHAGPDAWPERRTATPAVVSPDPWGNQYLIVVSAGQGVVVLSAGANGIVETSFDAAMKTLQEPTATGGDDISCTRTFIEARPKQ